MLELTLMEQAPKKNPAEKNTAHSTYLLEVVIFGELTQNLALP